MIVNLINGMTIKDTYKHLKSDVKASNNQQIKDWLEEGRRPEMPKIKKKCGWIKHAFKLCVRYLRMAKDENPLGPEFYER